MGECPGWFHVLRAADRLRCSPWELLDPDDPAPRLLWAHLADGADRAVMHAREMHQRLADSG